VRLSAFVQGAANPRGPPTDVPDALPLGHSLDGEHQGGGIDAVATIRLMVFRCLSLRQLPTSHRPVHRCAQKTVRSFDITNDGLFSA
jgi:hypothetical protein